MKLDSPIYSFVILLLLSASILYVSQNYIISEEILTDHFSQQMSIERIQQMLDFRGQWAWVKYVALPFIYLIKFVFISAWLLCGVVLFGYQLSFSRIFRVVLIAEFVWMLPLLLTVLWFGLIDTDYTVIDVKFFQPLSLLNFFNAEQVESWLVFPLKALNLFELAYMAVMAIGIKKEIKRSYKSSLNFVIPVYGSGLVTWIVFMTFISLNMAR